MSTTLNESAGGAPEKIDGAAGKAMRRAYSRFLVRDVSDGQIRTLSGIATTISTDRMGDIVESSGAQFELPVPFLWQHDSEQPIGWVTAARVDDKEIGVDVRIAQIADPGPLKDRVDMAWQSLKAKLVQGLSIGFAPIEFSIIQETYGYRFLKWAWLELSAVTIPANADASISAIKRFDRAQLAATGHKSSRVISLVSPPGVTGKRSFKLQPTR